MTAQNNQGGSELRAARAFISQDGDTFVEVAKGEARCWISVQSAASQWDAVKKRLADHGILLITDDAIRTCKKLLQDTQAFGDCLAASRPGWVAPDVYIHLDGTVQQAADEERVLIQSFDRDPAFSATGTLEEWRSGMQQYFDADLYLRFGMYFGIIPLFLDKAPSQAENPIMELVGDTEVGKTTVARCIGSLYGGSLNNGLGIGHSANMTKAAFTELQQLHHHTLFYVDETNVMDRQITENLTILFDAGSGADRARYGDSGPRRPVRNCVVLTGNQPLEDHGRTPQAIRDAARTRCITLRIRRPLFTTLPAGFQERGAAIGAVLDLISRQHGTASRAIIGSIIERVRDDGQRWSRYLEGRMAFFRRRIGTSHGVPDRTVRVFALCFAVARFAIDRQILPKAVPLSDIIDVFQLYAADLRTSSMPLGKRELLYVLRENKRRITRIDALAKNPDASTSSAWRYTKDNDVIVFLKASEAERWFGPQRTSVMRALRNEGILIGEGGAQPKLSIKPPKCVPCSDRVYKFILSKSDVSFLLKKGATKKK